MNFGCKQTQVWILILSCPIWVILGKLLDLLKDLLGIPWQSSG